MIIPKRERILLPPERKRDKQLKIWVSQEELDMIHQKMAEFGTSNMGAFVRKMVIDGYIVKLDIPELRERKDRIACQAKQVFRGSFTNPVNTQRR